MTGTDDRWVGRALRRVEDPLLLRGRGLYVDDVQLPGTVHVAFVRSPHAHARIRRLDLAAARESPGVVLVVSGAETKGLGHLRPVPIVATMRLSPHPILVEDIAPSVGAPVAAVVAESASRARDAVDRVEV